MEKNRMNHEDSLRILLALVALFLCTADAQGLLGTGILHGESGNNLMPPSGGGTLLGGLAGFLLGGGEGGTTSGPATLPPTAAPVTTAPSTAAPVTETTTLSTTTTSSPTTRIPGIPVTTSATLQDITPSSVTNTTITPAGALNATISSPNLPLIYPLSNSTDATAAKLICLQGWAIFLICLGTTVTVFLLAGISLMLYRCRKGRRLPPQQRHQQHNQKVYVAPEEQAIELE